MTNAGSIHGAHCTRTCLGTPKRQRANQVLNFILGREKLGIPSLRSVAETTQVACGAGLVPSSVSVELTNKINMTFKMSKIVSVLFWFLTFE